MRGFIVGVVILVILGAVVFFFGWIQFKLPAGTVGVIFTRTNGWEEEPVVPGAFVWRWQRLLPTNLTLYVFDVQPHTTRVSLNGALPSAEFYEEIVGSSGSLEYRVELTVTASLKASALPPLAETRSLRPENLDSYLRSLDDQITQIATATVTGLLEDDPDLLSAPRAHTTVSERVTSRLETLQPDLEVLSVSPTRIEVPDMDLYARAKELAGGVMDARAASLREAADQVALDQAESDYGLARLERYGEILERYPVLLDYFRLGKDLDTDPLNIEELIPQTAQ